MLKHHIDIIANVEVQGQHSWTDMKGFTWTNLCVEKEWWQYHKLAVDDLNAEK